MTVLVLAVLVFIAAHSIPTSPRVRGALIRRLGRPGYLMAYSGLSLLLAVWVAVAYRQAPVIWLWGPDLRLHWVPVLGMPVVCLLVSTGLLTPNALSLTFRGPHRGGDLPPLLRLTRHPVLIGLALWALLHICANGDVASLILFGLMGGLALGGMAGMDLRYRRAMGAAHWRELASQTRWLSLSALPGLWRSGPAFWGGCVVAVGLYALLLAVHQPVIGVSPLPW